MEAFFTLIIIYLVFSFVGKLIGTGARAVGAGAKTIMDGGSFLDNFSNKLQFKIEKLPSEKDDLYETFGVFTKGDPQVRLDHNTCLVFKLFDKETELPVISTFEVTSEKSSRVFEHIVSTGNMNGKYWADWVRVSALLPESLIGPHKGMRKLELRCFVWYEDYLPQFDGGFLPEGASTNGCVAYEKYEFDFDLENTGYLEIDSERLEVQKASVRLGVSIAMADGTLDKSEGNEIKSWIKGIIASSSESQKQKVKDTLNQALEDAFNDAKSNNIDLNKVCLEIKDTGSKADKFDLIELCLDVMAADGEADKEELRQISKIAELIGVDYEEINRMKDQRLVKLDPNATSNAALEDTLGIDPKWDKEKINSHILSQYSKWNGRLNSLPEGTERENAQKMLDLIAEARSKYS